MLHNRLEKRYFHPISKFTNCEIVLPTFRAEVAFYRFEIESRVYRPRIIYGSLASSLYAYKKSYTVQSTCVPNDFRKFYSSYLRPMPCSCILGVPAREGLNQALIVTDPL